MTKKTPKSRNNSMTRYHLIIPLEELAALLF